tara:strand:+ start:1480 stop:1833 length:354 start_codon:yes stop_codon:yes gene_type:complete
MLLITQNGEYNMIYLQNKNAIDPNWAKVSKVLEANNGNHNAMVWTHLTPTKVVKNTKKHYIAKYRDEHGAYTFEIKRNKRGMYDVCSAGVFAVFGLAKSKLVWEFENQINTNAIKCI